MASTRLIREGLLTSERMAALSDQAWRFYVSLFLVVDDYGRVEFSPVVLRGRLWPHRESPYSTVEIREMLAECTSGTRPLILDYSVNGKQFIQIQDFGQRVQSKSKCPDPPSTVDHGEPRLNTVDHGESPSRASRARTKSESETKSYPKSETAATSESEPQGQQQPKPKLTSSSLIEEFPLSCQQICTWFPDTTEVMLGRIIVASCKADPKVNDELLLRAIHAAGKKKQESAALFEHTLPPILANWRKYPPAR